ncbi:gluconolactonase [Paraburkholderia sp. BL8N3]|nr:SMP-30/gluconolactonase/LRE family protein [Paraburkholderia sp. BL8N3]TCK39361.1 gluconolactonase [Paraburkholderia sp. BL8N3]
MSKCFIPVDYHRFRRYMTHAVLEELHTGLRWAEGPVWFADAQMLLYTDVPGDRIYRWVEGQGASVFRHGSNHANGMTRDRQGRLVVCESGGRRVTRTELDGRITVLAERFEGKRLNSPNDVVVKSDGTVWFSDPDYGILSDYTGTRADSEIGACNVFRYDPADGSLGVACEGLAKPNGLAFSPDERTLYVADSGRTHDPDGPHQIVAFDVAADGRTGHRRPFAQIPTGVPDGFRVDVDGNIWTSTVDDGVLCFAPDGALIGRIHVPEPVANLTFGGPKLNRLFIAAGQKLYSIFTGTRGLPLV